jgi:hypothetical protein
VGTSGRACNPNTAGFRRFGINLSTHRHYDPGFGQRSIHAYPSVSIYDPINLSVNILTPPTGGTAIINADNTILYTPRADFTGPDEIDYSITDTDGTSAGQLISISVLPPSVLPPMLLSDTAETIIGQAVAIDAFANDYLPAPATIQMPPAHGAVYIADNLIHYTPSAGFFGVDSFTYSSSNITGSSTATVTVTVAVPLALFPNTRQLPLSASNPPALRPFHPLYRSGYQCLGTLDAHRPRALRYPI